MELTLGYLYHTTVWNETEERWIRAYDCEDVWIHLVRRPDTPLDVENLTAISICGVKIGL